MSAQHLFDIPGGVGNETGTLGCDSRGTNLNTEGDTRCWFLQKVRSRMVFLPHGHHPQSFYGPLGSLSAGSPCSSGPLSSSGRACVCPQWLLTVWVGFLFLAPRRGLLAVTGSPDCLYRTSTHQLPPATDGSVAHHEPWLWAQAKRVCSRLLGPVR